MFGLFDIFDAWDVVFIVILLGLFIWSFFA